jgi:broad specificity phosphatase PhoE
MDRLVLARHGESVASVSGRVNGDPAEPLGLTAAGRAQARRLGDALAARTVDLAVTSAFPRTIETAAIALTGRSVPRLVLAELNDLVFGVFEDAPLADYRAWVAAHEPEDAPPAGESRADSVRRWTRGFRAVLERPERDVLVVCHGMPIRYVLAAAEGVAPAALAEEIGYAEPHELGADELATALGTLEGWCAAPAWGAEA